MTEEGSASEVAEPPDDEGARAPIDLAEAIRHATALDWVCVGGIVASILVGLLSYPLSAFLLAHVKTHLAITAGLPALLTGGAGVFYGRESLLVVMVLAIFGLTKFGPFYFWAGRRYGDGVARLLEEQGGVRPRTVARAERWVARFGPALLTASYFVPVPSTLVMAMLGASGVSWFAFAVADLAGALAWTAIFVSVGHHFHTQVDDIAHTVTHYSRLVAIALFVVVFVVAWVRARRQLASQA